MTDELISQPTEMQRMRIIIEETLDAQDAVIDRLNRKIATDRIALAVVQAYAIAMREARKNRAMKRKVKVKK